MKVFSKRNSDYTKLERGFTSLFSFIVFGVIGGIIRLFSDPIQIGGTALMLQQFLPYILGIGGLAALLGYFFPKPLNIVMCFLPLPGLNS